MQALRCAGMVILMTDARMEPSVARDMLQGQPDALRSEFHLSYAMILGLARGQALVDIEALLARSFRQAQAQNGLPALRQRMGALQVLPLALWYLLLQLP